jgi:hypothetical protein
MARHERGWIKKHRRILDHWIGRDPYANAVFDYLVLRANRERSRAPVGREMVFLERGQVMTSAGEIAGHWGMNRKTVQRILDQLEADGSVTQTVSQRGRIITVVNYGLWQGSEEDAVPEVVPPSGQQNGQQKGHLMEKGEEKSKSTPTIRYSVTEMRMHAKRAFAEVRALLVDRAVKPTLTQNAQRFVETSLYERWDDLATVFAVEKNTHRDGMFLKNLLEMFERNAEFALTGQATGLV